MKKILLLMFCILMSVSFVSAKVYAPDNSSARWVTKEGGVIVNTGVLNSTDRLFSRRTVIMDEDTNEFLNKLNGEIFPNLPESGWLEEGTIYLYDGSPVIVRQSHNRTEHDPADVPALFMSYQLGGGSLDWIPNEQVVVGDIRSYSETEYQCIQSHVTQEDWTPPAVPALWTEYTEPVAGEWAVGVAYEVDDEVTYSGSTYVCIQAHTSQAGWTPPAVPALWGLME